MSIHPSPLPFTTPISGISEKTLQIHHDKLYAGYVNKLNEIEEKNKTADQSTANATYSEFGEIKREESFAANGVYLHEFYFRALGGDGNSDNAPDLKQALTSEFDSFEKWLSEFKATGMCARGWVVLAYNLSDNRLHNYLCDIHNHGGIWNAVPILVMDTYEHAFFIDFGSDKKNYIEQFFANINWKEINNAYIKAKKIASI